MNTLFARGLAAKRKAIAAAAGLFLILAFAGSARAETVYGIELTASDGTTTGLVIHDSLNPLPGSDTWTADAPEALGVKGGAVSGWGQPAAFLTGPVGVQSIVLDGFTKGTKAGDTGAGAKHYDDGTFPMDSFTWRCTSKQ